VLTIAAAKVKPTAKIALFMHYAFEQVMTSIDLRKALRKRHTAGCGYLRDALNILNTTHNIVSI
jgi:hypothetical protein